MSFNILRNVVGELEIGRVYLSVGGLLAMFSPIGFEWWDMFRNGAHFDVTAWCVAYPGGLGALAALGLFTIGKKEKDVATARAAPGSSTETTTKKTMTGAPSTPQPVQDVYVTNPRSDPVQTTQGEQS